MDGIELKKPFMVGTERGRKKWERELIWIGCLLYRKKDWIQESFLCEEKTAVQNLELWLLMAAHAGKSSGLYCEGNDW